MTFPMLLAEAVFCGNCLTHVSGVTPYQVVYGRQPAMLPPLYSETDDLDVEGEPNDRSEARVREIALQTMVEATSQARINRAMRTRAGIPGEVLYELGDQVEHHRPSTSKDTPGWHGPGVVIEVLADQGQLVLRHRNEDFRCRFQDVRQFMGLGLVLPELQFGSTKEAFALIRSYLESLAAGRAPVFLN